MSLESGQSECTILTYFSFANGHTNEEGEPAIDPGDESLIVSILSLGTFLGALTAAPVADFFGRRMGIFLSTAIVFNLGVIMQTAATSQPLFIAGRFFAGYGVGLISAQVSSEKFRIPFTIVLTTRQ